ncbi:MAG: hypothetical protein Q8N23_05930 [Archangium sp.]|nr:hypothetical protein [Archangium sp.]MDP3152189.1 hypothetical protein [Archangium sp.]MDP3574930.1 hypothetical protein [Archangium sp.]
MKHLTACIVAAAFFTLLTSGCEEPCTTCNTGGGSGGGSGGGTGAGGGSGGGNLGTGGGTTGNITVTGRVTYDFVPARLSGGSAALDFGRASQRPVRRGVVQVIQGTTVLSATATGGDGSFSISYTPNGTANLALYALSQSVEPSISIEDNTDNNLLWAVGSTLTGQNQMVNLHAAHGWTGTGYDAANRAAAPFAILDSMFTASRAFMAARPNINFPPLKVNWSPNNTPQAGDTALGLIGTSHFSPAENELYILGKDGADTDEYDSHVIVHEWGHFFEANLSRSDSPGGRHGPGDILDPRIAFGEAWGNSVAAMVLPETVYVDTNWSGANMSGFGFDAETTPSPTDDPTPSGFSESSVLRLLYDIYDGNNEPHDGFGVGLGPIADVLMNGQKNTDAMTTLASFVTVLKAQPGVNASALNGLMAHYGIGPVTSAFGDGDADLRGMYTDASLPFSGNIALGGGNSSNSWQQNQYYVFTGNGSTVTVSASSVQDVAIQGFRRGTRVGAADVNVSGTESFTLNTQSGVVYVVVLTGFGATAGDYDVTVTLQ